MAWWYSCCSLVRVVNKPRSRVISTSLTTKEIANRRDKAFFLGVVALGLQIAINKATEKAFDLGFPFPTSFLFLHLLTILSSAQSIFGSVQTNRLPLLFTRASIRSVFQSTSRLFDFARGSNALGHTIQRYNECALRNGKSNVVATKKASGPEDGAHFESECPVLDVE